MQIFLDTASVDEVREIAQWGILDGVTTNPSLVAQSGRDFRQVIEEICSIVDGPVSAEVVSTDAKGMLREAHEVAAWHPNVVVKLPMTTEGLKALSQLSVEGVRTNVTLVFSATQALLAAKAGATYVSPFIGRLDDNGVDGMQLIREIRAVFDNYAYGTKILAASLRDPIHLRDCAIAGADVATLPTAVLRKSVQHVLTDKGLAQFLADWEKARKVQVAR